MSTPTRKPFLSDEDLVGYITANGVTLYTQHRMSPTEVRDKYEAHLSTKDALIRLLVDALDNVRNSDDCTWSIASYEAMAAAKDAGFTPTTEP